MEPMQLLLVVALALWILLSLALIAGLFLALPTLRRLSRLLRRSDRFMERTEREIEPVIDHLRRSADDLDFITSAVRSDVEAVGDTVDQAARTTRTLLELAEARAVEINGFLEVVQEEAEDSFYSTASVLRALRGKSGRKRR